MTAATYFDLAEYKTSDGKLTHSLYDGHSTPRAEGSVDDVITHLESLLYLDSPDIEPLTWQGQNGMFYDGADAGNALRAEIAALRDGSHWSLKAQAEGKLDYVPPTAEQEAAGMAFSLAPAAAQRDAEYLKAVEAGDMETAQRMVDAAAKKAGFDKYYRSGMTKREGIIPWASFSPEKWVAESYQNNPGYGGPILRDVFVKPQHVLNADGTSYIDHSNIHHPFRWEIDDSVSDEIVNNGYDAIVYTDAFPSGAPTIVFTPNITANQIKSADPVTRDEAGNVIPLSKRFNSESPDDPTAVDQLEARVAELEAQQTRWKSINARVRKLKVTRKTPELAKRLLEALDEDECRELMAGLAHYGEAVAIASFQMSNNNANLNRLKKRLERVKRNQSAADVEREGNGIRCVDSPSENRLRLYFPGKPDSVVRDGLKKAGFRWSPSNGCWQAFRTWRAMEHAKAILA